MVKHSCSRLGAAVALCFLVVLPAVAGPRVMLSSGKTVEGSSVKVAEGGEILLQTDKGLLTFPKGTRVVIDEPAAYARAVRLLKDRNYAAAAEVFQEVIAEYRFLGWDDKAKPLLARAYLGSREFDKAVATFDAVIAAQPIALEDDKVLLPYLEALMGAGEQDKLAPALDRAIGKGSRTAAARAQVMRGRLRLEQGQFARALYDFMRTAELFTEQSDVQAEAVYLAGTCLEKLGDVRAAEFFDRVVREHKDSSFAALAKARLP